MRRKLMYTLFLVFLLSLFAGSAYGGEIYATENTKGNIPIAVQKNPVVMEPVKEIMGRGCTGFTIGLYHTFNDGSIRVWRGEMAPNGYISMHYGDNVWLCYIIEGEGEFRNADYDLNVRSTIKWKPGDVIVTRPKTMHDWKNGDKKTVFIGVEQVIPK